MASELPQIKRGPSAVDDACDLMDENRRLRKRISELEADRRRMEDEATLQSQCVPKSVFDEIKANHHCWGEAHDESHTNGEWANILSEYVARVRHNTPTDARYDLVKIAAVACAAISAFDRNQLARRCDAAMAKETDTQSNPTDAAE